LSILIHLKIKCIPAMQSRVFGIITLLCHMIQKSVWYDNLELNKSFFLLLSV